MTARLAHLLATLREWFAPADLFDAFGDEEEA